MGRISADTGKPIADAGAPVANASGAAPAAPAPAPKSVFQASARTAEFFDHLRAHYRESKRAPVEVNASMKILLMDGSVYDSGTAVVLNVSPSGALLGKVKISGNCYPVQPFKLELVMTGGEYDGIGIEALPVRFEHEHGGLGVKFQEIFVAV
jgi:hypothetical protein